MKSSVLSAITLASAIVNGYLVTPPGPVLPSTVSDCSGWVLPVSGNTCATVEAAAGITAAQFILMNPLAGTVSSCTIVVGFTYCIKEGAATTSTSSVAASTTSAPTTLTTITSTASPTTSGNGIATPTPIQAGMVSNCNTFHLVVSGDGCSAIASAAGVSLDNFYSWNPAVETDCSLLYLGYYVCVGTTTVSATTVAPSTTSTTTITSGNGISTPTPTQTGMVSNCNSFHLVVSGDGCSAIASAAGISIANFYSWNPAVGTDCSLLYLGYYVCIGTTTVSGTTTSTTSTATTTSSGNGISTPTPVQTGMTTSCNTFYDVVTGDSCATIAAAKGISLANFYTWNPAVGSSCGSLWTGYYVCVNVIGGTTSTSTKVTTTTTAVSSTPTPVQTGMVANCKTFHLVVSGDGCAAIATNAGITLANFYAWNPAVGSTCGSLWLGYYVCIGI